MVALAILIGIISGLVHLFSAEKTEKENAAYASEDGTVSWTEEEKPEALEEEDTAEAEPEEEPDLQSVSSDDVTGGDPADDEDGEDITLSEQAENDDQEVSAEQDAALLAEGENEITLENKEKENAEIESRIDTEIGQMTLEEKISKLFILTPGQISGTELENSAMGNRVGDQLLKYPISGILFKPANLDTEENLFTALDNLTTYGGGSQMRVISEQGGESSPFVVSGITENIIASEKEIGESLGTAGAYSAGISIGSELKHYGMQMNIAPYADVSKAATSYAAAHGFNQDIETTSELTANMVRGMKDQNIITALGCFPGYGDVTNDGTNGVPVSQRTRDQLLEESAPYQAAIKAGADAVIISHVGLPRIRGDQRPACLSKEVVTDIVREEWGFDGVIMTDYMDKSCIYQKYTYAEAAVGAIEAGVDILLSTKNFQKSYAGILDAVKKGTLSEERINESVRRILRMKYRQEANKASEDNFQSASE